MLLWVLWECLIMPINNDSITLEETFMPKVLRSTCRKLWSSSACQKSTSSLTYYLRYCKDIANLLFWELWECLITLINIIVSICSKLSCLSVYEKSTSSITSFLRYCNKIANFFFFQILQRNRANFLFPGKTSPVKNELCQFFNVLIIYHCAKNLEKLMSHSWEK